MTSARDTIPIWILTNAWREIFARIFADIETTFNVTPEWLINPATNRRLKLDMLYPELDLAVRIEGLQGKNRRQRPSLDEEIQQQIRDKARIEICRQHGIELIVIDMLADDPKPLFQDIDMRLGRAGERLSHSALAAKVREARATAATIGRRVKTFSDIKPYADLWEDRQYKLADPVTVSTPPSSAAINFTEGTAVEHTAFGPGVIVAIAPNEGDPILTVDFITAGQKSLIASLVGDKLWVKL